MKINESQHISNIQRAYGKFKGNNDSKSGALKRKDEVSISSEALELLQTQKLSQSEKTQKLEELKLSVAAGTYSVDAGKLAEKLLPFLR